MMKRKTSRKTSPSKQIGSTKRVCLYCTEKRDPDYKDFEGIRKFVNDRGRIAGRKRSGLCARHQRRLAAAVKRARFLGLL